MKKTNSAVDSTNYIDRTVINQQQNSLYREELN